MLNIHERKSPWIFILLLIIAMISSSNSASITTFSSTIDHQLELVSNSTYRNFYLRQYFIDLLNISHSTLIQSMIQTHQFIPKLEQIKYRRRRQISTIYSTNCFLTNNQQIQTTFPWSHSIEPFSSVELIYHLNSKMSSLPMNISIKESATSKELLSLSTNLQYDSNRDLHSIDLSDYIRPFNHQNLLLRITLNNQTCQTLHGYIILGSKQISSNEPHLSSKCRLKTLPVKFEELGLADLIIRPKEYTFTYCDGSCSNPNPSSNQFSFRTFLQSILSKNHSNLPRITCVPSDYSDDHFLLRQSDGNLQISLIKNVIVKQCACL